MGFGFLRKTFNYPYNCTCILKSYSFIGPNNHICTKQLRPNKLTGYQKPTAQGNKNAASSGEFNPKGI